MKSAIKKISIVLIGRVLYETFNYSFDFGLYPLVLLKYGYSVGLIIMITLTAIINFVLLFFYFKINVDWLGYSYIEKIKEWSINKKGLKKLVGLVLKKSDFFVFFALSAFRDSFETTAYFKHSYHLSKGKTISVFLISLIVGNVYWSLGVEVFINSWLRYLV